MPQVGFEPAVVVVAAMVVVLVVMAVEAAAAAVAVMAVVVPLLLLLLRLPMFMLLTLKDVRCLLLQNLADIFILEHSVFKLPATFVFGGYCCVGCCTTDATGQRNGPVLKG